MHATCPRIVPGLSIHFIQFFFVCLLQLVHGELHPMAVLKRMDFPDEHIRTEVKQLQQNIVWINIYPK